MKHLVLHFNQKNLNLDNQSFSVHNLNELLPDDKLTEVEKQIKGINEADLRLYQLSVKLAEFKSPFASIIIIKNPVRWAEVVRMAIYLRLCSLDYWFSKVPFFLCSDNLPDLINSPHEFEGLTDVRNYLNIPGVFYKKFFELFGSSINEEGEQDYGINNTLNHTKSEFDHTGINISSENLINDRHHITNQWGAVKLALNAGYNAFDIGYEFPPTLYFNYLIKKYGVNKLSDDNRQQIFSELKLEGLNKERVNLGQYLKNKKILLIDDNADKGWEAVLEKIFGIDQVDCAEDYEKINQFGSLKNISSYDLIFLDLRLPKIQNTDNQYRYGIDLLAKIKKDYPQIPVIVFTASNKSWTLNEVLEKGADGMYVKESPEFASDESYSFGNFRNFIKTTTQVLITYKTLRPYWEAIENIYNSTAFKNIIEKEKTTQFKARIKERLEMFYGLLKRGFEQREYNRERFYLSDYELAFMTLWSVLNEISEAYYDKRKCKTTVIDQFGNPVSKHPCKKDIEYFDFENKKHRKWTIVNQSDIFVDYTYDLIIDQKTNKPQTDKKGNYYKLSFKQYSNFEIKEDSFTQLLERKETKVDYEKTLYMQIAFLLEKKTSLCKSTNKGSFQKTLIRLNDVRNKLYLTHGSDIVSNFYDDVEKNKRESNSVKPDKDIKDLFELVSFLLTGLENELIF